MPLTHIGRVCPHATDVHGEHVPEQGRVSLCWASANLDPEAFEEPTQVKLDRRPNPHVAFGYGPHNCLGAHHARLVTRTLIEKLAAQIDSIELIECIDKFEKEKDFTRKVGHEKLRVAFNS
jgi:hypothetical protein